MESKKIEAFCFRILLNFLDSRSLDNLNIRNFFERTKFVEKVQTVSLYLSKLAVSAYRKEGAKS